jgi:MerR family transcriptional regulator/heat shock protein HspR
MDKNFWTVSEIIECFEIDKTFLVSLEREEIICPTYSKKAHTECFTPRDVEKLRLAKILIEDMGVNLAGVEVILRMRENMFDMRNQFDSILEDLLHRFKEALKEKP